MPVVGIYFGYSGISVSYVNNNTIVNLDVFRDGFVYPILHSEREVYGKQAFTGLFTEPKKLISNLLFLLSKDNFTASDSFLCPFPVTVSNRGELCVSSMDIPVSELIRRLLIQIYNVTCAAIHSDNNSFVFAFPLTLKDNIQDKIISIAKNCGFKDIERIDCLTCYAVFKNIEFIPNVGGSNQHESRCVTFLVIDEHESYSTTAAVDCIPGNITTPHCFQKLRDINRLSVTIRNLILSIRNYIIKTYLMRVFQYANITDTNDPQYILLNQQLYVYLAGSLTQYYPEYHFADVTITLNNHRSIIKGTIFQTVCSAFINRYVKTCIADLMKQKNYDPNRHVYVVGDYANLFTAAANLQYNSVQNDITCVLSSFSSGAACCSTRERGPTPIPDGDVTIYSYITEMPKHFYICYEETIKLGFVTASCVNLVM